MTARKLLERYVEAKVRRAPSAWRTSAVVPDASGNLLDALQRHLPYPWLKPPELAVDIDRLLARSSSFDFLYPFREPVAVSD